MPTPQLVDSFIPIKSAAKPSIKLRPTRTPLRRLPKATRPYATPPQKHQWLGKHPILQRIGKVLLVPAMVLIGIVGGLLVQSLVIGQICLAVYAVLALVLRINSRTTFAVAFLLLCGLVAMLLFHPNATLATNFAVYAFILLLIGVVSLLREVKEVYA